MTEPRDEITDVQQAYRSLPDEPVPSELDERVLAIARSALEAKPRSSLLRWSAPIALAASVLVVVAIVLDPAARKTAEVSRLHEAADWVAASQSTEAPAAVPDDVQHDPPPPLAQQDVVNSSAEPPRAAKAQRPERTAQARAEERAKAMREEISAAKRYEATAAQYRAPEEARVDAVASPPADSETSTAGQQESLAQAAPKGQDATPSQTAARPIAPVAFLASSAASVASVAEKDPELAELAVTSARRGSASEQRLHDWLYRIHELQAQGKKREAAREIKALERQYPWVDVPEELRNIRKAEQR